MIERSDAKKVDFNSLPNAADGGGASASGDYSPSLFHSILFASRTDLVPDSQIAKPSFFADLHCDQIVSALTAGKEEYNLRPFFYARLSNAGAIEYRHNVMRDLEQTSLYELVSAFGAKMREVREHVRQTQKMYYKEQREAWLLNGIEIYAAAVQSFAAGLARCGVHSSGFLGFREYLATYAASANFHAMLSELARIRSELAAIEYNVLIKGSGFTVTKYERESDYSAEVESTFEKFKQAAVRDYTVKFAVRSDMNHIEAKILEFVAKLFPEAFGALETFCQQHRQFIDGPIALFDREVQFYMSYLAYVEAVKHAGLPFCYPRVSATVHEVFVEDGYDIALAHKLIGENKPVVCNDFHLSGSERVLVVSGPNQGGKTTFARTFGQLHYLASIGCPVPGSGARLLLFDELFTHFEREEKVENLRGKLEDDLVRIHDILGRVTSQSIIIMNEIFNSTTIQDEIFLSEKVMQRIIQIGLLCVWVTFVDELASFGPETVSMVSTVVPENPALRTFKLSRRPADGLAYAMAIVQKYGLMREVIRKRIRS